MALFAKTRLIAWEILYPQAGISEFPTSRLYKKLQNTNLDKRDIDFVTNLVTGTLQHSITLEAIIKDSCLKKTKMAPSVKVAIMLATYELKILGKRSDVVLNEYVELVKTKARHASGLTNALLHQIDRSSFYERLSELDDASAALPDLAIKYSLQTWMVEYLIQTMGKLQTIEFMKLSLLPSTLSKVGEIIADKSSQEIVRSVTRELDVYATFLEVGAGRGTKTLLINYYKDDLKTYDALELSQNKCEVLNARCKDAGIELDHIYTSDATDFKAKSKYDAVFIDAPCSGLGTLRRHPEIRTRITSAAIDSCADLSYKILENMSRAVKRGGALFYATCTITSQENEKLIDKFLSSRSGSNFRVVKTIREPRLTADSDAHYCVMLMRDA